MIVKPTLQTDIHWIPWEEFRGTSESAHLSQS